MPSFDTSLYASSTVRKMILLMWTPTHSWGNYNRLVMFIYAYFLTIYRWPTTNKFFFVSIVSCFVRQGGEEADDHDEATSNMN